MVQPKEVECILRRLDIDGDSRVSFHEFVEAVSAVQPEMMPVQATRVEHRDPPADVGHVRPEAMPPFQGPRRSAAEPLPTRNGLHKEQDEEFTLAAPTGSGVGNFWPPRAGAPR
jgi:hypothetical protein